MLCTITTHVWEPSSFFHPDCIDDMMVFVLASSDVDKC